MNLAIKLNPLYTNAYYYLGHSQYRERAFEPAVLSFSRALELDPQRVWAFYYRGLAYRELGQYDLARADLQQILQLAPGTSVARLAERRLR
jgi:tetratricopeptide (TPR) repeat protein